MAASASDWLKHFRLLLWNRWTKFNETWTEARSQRHLPSLCFSGQSENEMAAPSSDWPQWDIFNFSSKTAVRNSTKLDGKQDLNVLYQVCVFQANRKKQIGHPASDWLIDILDFSSETVQQNTMKLDRKQDLNVLYHVGVFRADRKNKVVARPLIGWDIFDFSSETWHETRSQRPLPSLWGVFRPISKQKLRPRPIRQKGGVLY